MGDVCQRDGNINAVLFGIPYDDITAALDYFFEHYNEGRPFIIAGHSRHGEDYTYFYNNIKDNVAKRIATYKANRS